MAWLSRIIDTQPWVLLFLLPMAGVQVWYRIRSSAFRLSKQRTERLYALTRKGAWRQADPLALQLAVSDAFRSTIDDRWIAFALLRHNPIRLLIDGKYAKGIVRLASDGSGFEDNRKFWRPSLRATSWGLYVASISPWIAASVISVSPWASPGLLAALAAVGVVYTPTFTWLGICVEAARRLTHKIDENYLVRNVDQSVSSLERTEIKKAMPKQRRRKTVGPVDFAQRVN